ncbi:bifunctional precorrin-2 dehydrogenase/sirohydrochlorin ferrochelatase [Halorarum halophilum]|uniref:precorrin-2 dehydrogenase n=1 Tax=Halorarum halophilum TaxID=2743090 RepID=A0A7D5GFG5_9EURY|nr:bifunctional precorrin-2 dehydrogenase/sirohydrochlorin ferrochelatase [Halobaculum halophilum]QLG27730.1 bifunctional precorrin-2 dehydrogenase/sirohydrochlorin ferrochelatase [Halobaculum halophilum]
MIPLFHDFTDETVLVFGGGRVGARKARRFAREARTVVVSPEFADADFGDAELVRAAPTPGDAGEFVADLRPALVVAATDDPAVNDAAESAAREVGSLVNRADRAGGRDAGSVVVPATVREDPVVAALATGGTAPALSRYLRERLEDELADAGAMAELVAELRAELKATDVPEADRHEAIRAVVESPKVWKGLQDGTANALQEAERVMQEVLDD